MKSNPPKIKGKDSGADKASWLHGSYTIDALSFYLKEQQEAITHLISAAAVSQDVTIARRYEILSGITEIVNLLSYNEQNREDDD